MVDSNHDPSLGTYGQRISAGTEYREVLRRDVPKDNRWLQRLHVHLKPLGRWGILELWDNTRIAPGMERRREREEALARARLAILRISADFLASDPHPSR